MKDSPHSLRVMLRGAIDRIGEAATLTVATEERRDPILEREVVDYSQAVQWLFERLGAVPVEAIAIGSSMEAPNSVNRLSSTTPSLSRSTRFRT